MSDHSQIILAGDIGGTKSNLAILSIEHETLKIHRNHRFPSGDYTSLNAIIHEFLEAEKGHIPAACFGVPGPVKYGRARPTNLNWGVDGKHLDDGSKGILVQDPIDHQKQDDLGDELRPANSEVRENFCNSVHFRRNWAVRREGGRPNELSGLGKRESARRSRWIPQEPCRGC